MYMYVYIYIYIYIHIYKLRGIACRPVLINPHPDVAKDSRQAVELACHYGYFSYQELSDQEHLSQNHEITALRN